MLTFIFGAGASNDALTKESIAPNPSVRTDESCPVGQT